MLVLLFFLLVAFYSCQKEKHIKKNLSQIADYYQSEMFKDPDFNNAILSLYRMDSIWIADIPFNPDYRDSPTARKMAENAESSANIARLMAYLGFKNASEYIGFNEALISLRKFSDKNPQFRLLDRKTVLRIISKAIKTIYKNQKLNQSNQIKSLFNSFNRLSGNNSMSMRMACFDEFSVRVNGCGADRQADLGEAATGVILYPLGSINSSLWVETRYNNCLDEANQLFDLCSQDHNL